jgi:hypothetical protein
MPESLLRKESDDKQKSLEPSSEFEQSENGVFLLFNFDFLELKTPIFGIPLLL